MDDAAAARAIADAVGVTSAEHLAIVSRTLSHLGISTSRDQASGNERYPLLVLSTRSGPNEDEAQARFDFSSGRWTLDSRNGPAPIDPPLGVDWTKCLPATPHVDFVISRDWAASSLGPMSSWPSSLSLMTMKLLSDPRPAALYVGPQRIAIYNEPFSIIAASRHPAMMGTTCEAALPATWPFLSRIFDEVNRSGLGFSAGRFEMRVEKTEEFIEEAWYDGVFSPVRREDGRIIALYNSVSEITDSIMLARRSRIVHLIAAEPDFSQVTPWDHIVNACDEFERDIPLLMLYSTASQTSHRETCALHLEGCLGISMEDLATVRDLDLHENGDVFFSALRKAKAQGQHVLLDLSDEKWPRFFPKDVRWRGHGEAPTHVVVAPLFVTGDLAGFVVLGLNPRRPYDDAHQQFVTDFTRVAIGILSSSICFSRAEIREAELQERLTRHEKFLANVAELVTVGIYSQTHEGLITWANSKFWEISGIPNRSELQWNMSTFDYLPADVRDLAVRIFRESISEQTTKTYELPLNRRWFPPGSDVDEPVWILVSMTGEPDSVLGCITDISHLKWSEKLQSKKVEDAEEAKQLQERFMDMTSHELRNPLSAILQCADDIFTSCQPQNGNSYTSKDMRESAQTILFCAAHQQRVINDILTVSKLDSSMLEIAPISTNVANVVKQALHMYKAELAAHDIIAYFTEKKSFIDLRHENVICDSSRLTQVLINLLTNAIKFTKTAEKREIRVHLGASTTPPSNNDREAVQWFPSGREDQGNTTTPGSDPSEQFYIVFRVEDTGEGIPERDMSRLFKRFSQTNAMTHIKYGGSGLGLFISRELTELQGGMIGAKSIVGKGTTFVFYIKTQKAHGPEQQFQTEIRTDHPQEMVSRVRLAGSRTTSGTKRPRLEMESSTESIPRSMSPPESNISLSILIAEDNILNQKILKKQLERLGCTVYTADNGSDALVFLKTTRHYRENHDGGPNVDIMLIDWEMPIMDGLATVKMIRRMEDTGLITKHIPVLGTTGHGGSGQVQTALAAGMDDVISKPFTVTALMTQIKALQAG